MMGAPYYLMNEAAAGIRDGQDVGINVASAWYQIRGVNSADPGFGSVTLMTGVDMVFQIEQLYAVRFSPE